MGQNIICPSIITYAIYCFISSNPIFMHFFLSYIFYFLLKMQKILQIYLRILTIFLPLAAFLSPHRILFIIDLIGLCKTSISAKLPAQCPMSHGIPATHQLNPAYNPCLSPSAAPITT